MIEQLESLTTAMKLLAESNNNLADAMRSGGQQSEDTAKASKGEYDGPIYWINNKTGKYGACVNSAEWNAVKKKDADAVKVPESKYQQFIDDQEKEPEEKAEKPATKPKTKTTKPKPKKEPEPEEDTDDEAPEVDIPDVDEEELVSVFRGFMPQDMGKAERDERIAFVKAMLQRFGVNKGTELEGQDRGIAVRLIQLKEEGHDIDPTAKGWDALKVIADCEAAGTPEDSEDDDLV